jgi:hypothetical protein
MNKYTTYYNLHIRVGEEYYPVDYANGAIAWEGSGIQPTRFTEESKLVVAEELCGFKDSDYKFIEVSKQPLISNEVGTRLSLVE